jgi:hypothetical protein
MNRTFKATVAASVLAAAMLATAGPLAATAAAQNAQPANTQVPQPDQNSVNWPGAGYGAAALVGNLVYIPCKMIYAIAGSIVGGGTYLVTAGNSQASNTVFRSALGGDYVLTPQMIAGQQPINFSGPTATPPPVSPTSQADPNSTMASTGSTNVAPIAPLPPANPGPSSSSPGAGGQPLDHGSGPASSSGGTSIE